MLVTEASDSRTCGQQNRTEYVRSLSISLSLIYKSVGRVTKNVTFVKQEQV